jgi:hypothetical protein
MAMVSEQAGAARDPGTAFSTTPGHFEQAICTSD